MFRSCVTTASHAAFRLSPPKCDKCGVALPSSTARVAVGNKMLCPDHAYLAEHPGAATVSRERGHRKPQSQTLF